MLPDAATCLWRNTKSAILDIGEPAEALDCFAHVLAADPTYTPALKRTGDALHQLERFNEAADYDARALEIDARMEGCWFSRGTALPNLGQYESALTCYEKLLAINPSDPKARYNKCAGGTTSSYDARIFDYTCRPADVIGILI